MRAPGGPSPWDGEGLLAGLHSEIFLKTLEALEHTTCAPQRTSKSGSMMSKASSLCGACGAMGQRAAIAIHEVFQRTRGTAGKFREKVKNSLAASPSPPGRRLAAFFIIWVRSCS